ncbi:VOC family protein [Undibacterium pigrum]|uniref:Catechol 2,3-dioxygenase-like lactoylglutathione lyase family enzyme n=1 Tax=Undibacterium pigrum TaxID=401470 RepID=A0A318IWT0_9BURK|nr:VOC family protein [Undibacterium pigrum]PXX39775.1 catechol 2,3-dioxygenase-like lactoylglutathione lyase family enzyme [Undibacterium pigrum]
MSDLNKPVAAVTGLNHLTLSVSDLERSFRFYVEVLGLKPLARWKNGAYLLAGEDWICLSLDSECRTSLPAEYTHSAFSVTPDAFQAFVQKVDAGELQLWKINKSEGDSLYLSDPDGHKLELHVGDWQSRLESLKIKPYEGLILF